MKTDIALAIPEGHYGRIAPRSGLAAKHGIDVGAGVIDQDYRCMLVPFPPPALFCYPLASVPPSLINLLARIKVFFLVLVSLFFALTPRPEATLAF